MCPGRPTPRWCTSICTATCGPPSSSAAGGYWTWPVVRASGRRFSPTGPRRSSASISMQPSVEHASLNYDRRNLTFSVADARDLGMFADRSFGAVVAFEMLEHIAEQDRLLAEIQRVLEPEGLLIISTPDREAYDEAAGENPFHVRELSRTEFSELLRSRFANVATWGQRTVSGSALTAIDPVDPSPQRARTFFVEQVDEEWRPIEQPAPLYVVAVASNGPLALPPVESTLGDPGIQIVRAAERAAAERAQIAVQPLQQHVTELSREVAALRARMAEDAHTISSLEAAVDTANRSLARVEASVTWQLFQRSRARAFAALGGEESRPVLALQRSLRFLGRKLQINRARPPARAFEPQPRVRMSPGPIRFEPPEQPEVSIVIPLYSHPELTRAALESIRQNTQYVDYEVILVDDAADPKTKQLLRTVTGARVIVNEEHGLPAQHAPWRRRGLRALARFVQQRHRGRARAGCPQCSTAPIGARRSRGDAQVPCRGRIAFRGRRDHLARRNRSQLRAGRRPPALPLRIPARGRLRLGGGAAGQGHRSGRRWAASTSATCRCTTRMLTCASRRGLVVSG